MPNIIIEAADMPKETKHKLMVGLTEKASEITGIPESSFTVQLKVVPVENWCIGGVPLEDILNKKKQS